MIWDQRDALREGLLRAGLQMEEEVAFEALVEIDSQFHLCPMRQHTEILGRERPTQPVCNEDDCCDTIKCDPQLINGKKGLCIVRGIARFYPNPRPTIAVVITSITTEADQMHIKHSVPDHHPDEAEECVTV